MAIAAITSRIAIATTSSTAEKPGSRFGVMRQQPFVPLTTCEVSMRFRSTRRLSAGLSLQVFHEKLRNAIEDVNARGAVADAMATVGVDQEFGIFLGLHQLLLERHRIREMDVVVARGVRDEQLAFQACRKIHWRRIAIALVILLRGH